MSILNKALAALDADYQKRHQECAGRIAQAEEVLHKVFALFDKIARECGVDFAQVNCKVCLLDRNGSIANGVTWHSIPSHLDLFMAQLKDDASQRIKEKGALGRFHFSVSISLPPIRDTLINLTYATACLTEATSSLVASTPQGNAGKQKLGYFPWQTEIEAMDTFIAQEMPALYDYFLDVIPPLEQEF